MNSSEYYVLLTSNGPVVQGAEITFIAKLYRRGSVPSGTYTYDWEDVSIPPHTRTVSCFVEEVLYCSIFLSLWFWLEHGGGCRG